MITIGQWKRTIPNSFTATAPPVLLLKYVHRETLL